MAEKVPQIKWNPWETMKDRRIINIARKYYPEIKNPERMLRYDLIKRLDDIASRPVEMNVVDVNIVGGFFMSIWIRIRDFFDKKRNPEYWA